MPTGGMQAKEPFNGGVGWPGRISFTDKNLNVITYRINCYYRHEFGTYWGESALLSCPVCSYLSIYRS